MHILVVNCGSSSIKASIIDHASGNELARLRVERIGDGPKARFGDGEAESIGGASGNFGLRFRF